MESAENQAQSIPGNDSGQINQPSLSKTETLKLLNDSIDQLEQTIKGIKEDSAAIPSSDSINTLLNTTQRLANTVAPPPVTSSGSITEVTTQPNVTTKSVPRNVTLPPPEKPDSPVKPQQPKVDKIEKKRNLTWIVIAVTAIAIAIVAIFWLWLPQQQIASVSKPALPEFSSNLEEVNPEPTAEAPVIEPQINADNTIVGNSATESELLDSNLEESAVEALEILIPSELESPGRAKNLKMVTIEPKLDFTPEQTLVASLETKVANLTKNYPTDLLESIQVDLPQDSLLVNVTDNWYELDESRQNKLANEMLKRSREFGFGKLELKDTLGTLVARNPVIGDRIVILQNSKTEKRIGLPANQDNQL